MNNEKICTNKPADKPSSYKEVQVGKTLYCITSVVATVAEINVINVGKTLYCITSVYNGDIDLGRALEDLTVKKVLQASSTMLCSEVQ